MKECRIAKFGAAKELFARNVVRAKLSDTFAICKKLKAEIEYGSKVRINL